LVAREPEWPVEASRVSVSFGSNALGRADGMSGHVGHPLIAIDFFGAAEFRDVPKADMGKQYA
jgi:hypothetical protein